jgi:hypothetical protein
MFEDWVLWLKAWIDGAEIRPCLEAIYRIHFRKDSRNCQPGNVQQDLYSQIRNRFLPLAKAKGLLL